MGQAFQSADGSWFCFVVEDANGKLLGFAKGQRYAHSDQPDFAGELNKIYLLREYHRRGLGRRLLGHVARRFLSQGISSMLLFGDARNPSNLFYEALGAERLFAANEAAAVYYHDVLLNSASARQYSARRKRMASSSPCRSRSSFPYARTVSSIE